MPVPAQTRFEAGLAKLPEALRRRVEGHWEDFKRHQDVLSAAGADACLDTLSRVWGCSEFVARTCVQFPTLLRDLLESGELLRPYAAGELAGRLRGALAEEMDEQALKLRLRELRRREWLRLAWRDLAGWADLAEVVATLSEFADNCLGQVVSHSYRALVAHHGTPEGGKGRDAIPFVVLGVGKLGGEELNFSSDIDLIFAYPREGRTDGASTVSNHEFFTYLGRRLIAVLGDPTPEGFVFRVDMRLRPNGGSGPLALSFDAMEDYYQAHGREWERYALIKARVVAGDREAGEGLLLRLRPFVFRRYLDYGAVQALREMKRLIDRELRRKGIAENVKLGPGGIREIEFIAQTFQLIRGGRVPALQDRRLLPVLDYLGSAGMLPAQTAADLRDVYVYLRRVEHRLQMAADQQTQTLPQDELGRLQLALSLGHDDWGTCESELRRCMQQVHAHFEQLFSTEREEPEKETAQRLADVWLETLDQEEAAEILTAAGYPQPEAVISLLRGLRSGAAYLAFSGEGRGRMDRLLPRLLEAAGRSPDPFTVLARLVKLLEAIGRRSAYLALLVENPVALSQLVQLCGSSPWIAHWIGRHPVLLDELLDPARLAIPLSRRALADELRQRLARIPAEDLENQMEVLREFRHGHVLRVAATDIGPGLAPEQVGRHLSEIAEVVVREGMELAQKGLWARHGRPACDEGRSLNHPGFAVVAYGKLGSLELGYTSDLDMIFLYQACDRGAVTDGERSIPNEAFFARLGQRLIHILTARTPTGILYDVDMRLRPSGRAGPLVTSLEAFRGYQLEHAWTWEHQALVRARPVAGDSALHRAFAEVRREVLCLRRDPDKLRREVAAMRDKMMAAQAPHPRELFDLKQDRGGIVDIEFIVQYFVLRWAADHPELIRHTDNSRLLETLAGSGRLEQAWTRTLGGIYRRYLSVEQHLKLMERPPMIGRDQLVKERDQVTVIWRHVFD